MQENGYFTFFIMTTLSSYHWKKSFRNLTNWILHNNFQDDYYEILNLSNFDGWILTLHLSNIALFPAQWLIYHKERFNLKYLKYLGENGWNIRRTLHQIHQYYNNAMPNINEIEALGLNTPHNLDALHMYVLINILLWLGSLEKIIRWIVCQFNIYPKYLIIPSI